MNAKTSIAAFAALTLCLPAAHAMASPATNDAPLELVPHEVLVKLRPGTSSRAFLARTPGASLVSRSGQFGVVRLRPSGALLLRREETERATLRLTERMRAHPDVLLSQPNYLFKLAYTPNDPLYAQQWHYPAIQLPSAWDLSRGGGVKIAIIDTGRTAHPDLAGKWMTTEYNAENPGWPAPDNSNWRHGTHVAGIIGALSNNGIGGSGVCMGCRLLNARAVDTATGMLPSAYVANSIDWAVTNGARVLNMSFEFSKSCSDPNMAVIRDAIARAVSNNVTPVAAAGNYRANVNNVTPASCPGTISVAASNRDNQLATYSSRGSNIGVTAPGGANFYGAGIQCPSDSSSSFNPLDTSGVVSTWTTSPASGNAHCYRHLGGTSMAAPHVSGTIGLMLSVNSSLRPADIRSILRSTATPMPSCGSDCGPGLLNARAAVMRACELNLICASN